MPGIVILAGGKSSRMGTNKALLTVGGKPAIERIRDELREVAATGQHGAGCREVSHFVIVTNDPEVYRFLGEKTVIDRYPGRGPLAGIEAGLRASVSAWNLVVACDMPFVTAQAGRFLLEQAVDAERAGDMVDAVVPVIGGRLQPLFAVYHKRCADRIERLLQSEQLKIAGLLQQLRVKWVTETDFPAAIDTSRVFVNMNRPEEYEQVQRTLASGAEGAE